MFNNTDRFNETSVQIEKIFEKWNNFNSPGCVLGISLDGNLKYSKSFGLANLENRIPITNDTVFRVASVSKQFTAACILLLEEQGKLTLDDQLSKYFPELPDYANKMKIIHLLNHTSGIKDYLWLFNFAGFSFRALDIIDEELFLEMIQSQKTLNFEPGEKFLYSNSGYVILALLIKRVTNKSLKIFAKENIFDPLDMNHSHFHDDHSFVVQNRAKAYTLDSDENFIIFETYNELIGDGALFTTLNDLSKWDKNFYNNKLGKKDQNFVLKLLSPGVLNNHEIINYGLGIRITNYRGINQIYHSGMIAGFRATYMQFPDEKLSIFCLSNLGTVNPEELSHKVVEILLKNKISELTDEKNIGESLENNKMKIPEINGFYRNLKTKSVYSFTKENGKLIGKLLAVDPVILYTKTMYESFSNGSFNRLTGILEPRLEFRKENHSEYSLLAYESNGEKILFEKLEIPKISACESKNFCGEYYSEELDTTYIIENKENKLIVVIKRIGKIILEYQYIGENEFTCNQAYIKFYKKNNSFEKFELSSNRILKPILFEKIH